MAQEKQSLKMLISRFLTIGQQGSCYEEGDVRGDTIHTPSGNAPLTEACMEQSS